MPEIKAARSFDFIRGCVARFLRGAVVSLALLGAALASPPTHAQAPAQVSFTGVERVVAFADVHGAYDDLTRLLEAAGVVDADLRWAAGRTHVVSTGDLLDRGKDSRKVLDLLMRLQGEAAAAGGQLHVTLGNHEAMNLLGHVRDVAPGELEAYAAEEPAGAREKMRADWIARNGPDSGGAFDKRFPIGYLGHRVAFAPDGVYGRWLLALPVAVMIDETLFMHGAPSTVLAGLSLPEINTRYRTALTDYIEKRTGYDYNTHGKSGNDHVDFVPDEIVDRFCVLGDSVQHIEKLQELESIGVHQFAGYLQHDNKEETLRVYGETVIPAMRETITAKR